MRLITPTDPEGFQTESGSDPGSKFYQLTHDYLVPSLREWLTCKQQESRKGRAELKLAERTAVWQAKPERRHLPSLLEWARIRLLTDRSKWTEHQKTLMKSASRSHLAVCGTTLAVLIVLGVAIQQYVARMSTQTAVGALATVDGSGIPLAIKLLDELPRELVLKELKSRFKDASGPQRLALAYGLAHFGEVDVGAIVDGLIAENTPGTEMSNVVTALKVNRDGAAVELLQDRAAQLTSSGSWAAKTRCAIAAVYLGETGIAAEMLRAFPEETATSVELPNLMEDLEQQIAVLSEDQQQAPEHRVSRAAALLYLDPPTIPWDPIQRTTFIAEFPTWSGPLNHLADVLRDARTPELTSGLSLALGSTSPPADAASTLSDILKRWCKASPDSGTHSAATWALRQWGQDLPEQPVSSEPPSDRDWWHATQDLRLVRIPSGAFARDEAVVRVDQACWLSDREITVGQFQQFMDDTNYDGLKPSDWKGPYEVPGVSAEEQLDHPVQQVSWYDAVMFCNWLSEREGLHACPPFDGVIS